MSHCTNSCESCGKDITDSHLFEVPLRIETRSLIRKRRLFIRNRMSTSTSKETAKLNHTNLPNANEPPTHRNEPDSLLEPPAKKNSSSVANTEVKVKTEPQAKPCDEANLKQNAHEIINSYRMLCSHFLLECVRHSTAGVGEQHRGDGCVGEDAAVDAVLVDESSSNGVELETTRWHESCLKCDCCDVLIGELGNSVYERHGLLFCQRDYLRCAFPSSSHYTTRSHSLTPQDSQSHNELKVHKERECNFRHGL